MPFIFFPQLYLKYGFSTLDVREIGLDKQTTTIE
jgi:hypothetical protein